MVVWNAIPFDALTPAQLYAALQLRTDVFALEQNCVFQDMDGADALAVHLLGINTDKGPDFGSGGELVAYARLFPAGIKFAEASIGRVVTRLQVRKTGLGHQLMREAIAALTQTWGVQPIRIGAQAHLKDFYAQHGFVDMQLPYMEDGIPHIEMLRTL